MGKKFNKTSKMIFASVISFCMIVVVVIVCGKALDKHNEKQLQYYFQNVIDQNVEIMAITLEKHKSFAEGVAIDLSGYTNDITELQSIIKQKQSQGELQRFLRIGFAYPNGNCYGSDGKIANISKTDYFQESMRGRTVITDAFYEDTNNRTKLNVVSTPVRNRDNEIEGVVIESFLNSELTDIISRGHIAEIGELVLFNNTGKIIASKDEFIPLLKSSNLLEYKLNNFENKNISQVSTCNKSQYVCFDKDSGMHLFYAPLHLNGFVNNLSVAVLVNQKYMDQQLYSYRHNVLKLLGVLIYAAFLFLLYYFIKLRKQEQKQQKAIEHIAFIDEITGGDSYASFVHKMSVNHREGYLAMLTIANFSVIQSSCGYKNADKLLRKIHLQIKGFLHNVDAVGHIHNADFVMFIKNEEVANADRQVNLLNNYLDKLAEEEDTPPMVAYLGIIKYDKKVEIRELVNRARVALTKVLESRESYYSIYGPNDIQNLLENSNLEKNFNKYISQKRFEIFYQPKFDPFTDSIMGAEALVRLRDFNGQLIPPSKFIPLFESDGLIRRLDKYVFQAVGEMQKQRLQNNLPTIPISINLSRISLHYPQVAEEYYNIIKHIDLPIKYVPLEITESALVDNKSISNLLDKFSSLGFNLHIDDFGSGYSSLSALNVLPFSTIKVDKSLVAYIGGYSGNELIKHIVSLAKRLHMHVTVEGVETKEQVEFLKSLNCHSIQGYYYSKPLEYSEFDKLLNKTPLKVMIR